MLPETPARRIVRGYCQRLSAPGSEMVSLAGHAEALGVTPTHLARVCKVETGRTAAALAAERRLHRARTLLAETDVPAGDIARHLGFKSAAAFTRFIQTHSGLPPSSLRKGLVRNRPNPAVPSLMATSFSGRRRVAIEPRNAESNR